MSQASPEQRKQRQSHNIVIRGHGPYFDVATPRGVVRCTVRGSVKRERRKTDPVAVGDEVTISPTGNDEGVIEAVAPRRRALSRLKRGTDDVEQVILANPDQLIAVFSVTQPDPHPRMLDRFLLIAEAGGLESVVAVNKIDLDPTGELRRLFDPYRQAGYPVIEMSVMASIGLDELRERLSGKVSALAGPSGVGKSSLINWLRELWPDRAEQALRVGAISSATGKGRHTTTSTNLMILDADTYVADTPGLRALRPWGIDLDRLDRYFPEFRPYLGRCYYLDCTHVDEPDCAVIAAVEAGAINQERYQSYLILWEALAEEPSSARFRRRSP